MSFLLYLLLAKIKIDSWLTHPQWKNHKDNIVQFQDETKHREFCCRHYCPFSFNYMPLFLIGREKKGKGVSKKMHGVPFHQISNTRIVLRLPASILATYVG